MKKGNSWPGQRDRTQNLPTVEGLLISKLQLPLNFPLYNVPICQEVLIPSEQSTNFIPTTLSSTAKSQTTFITKANTDYTPMTRACFHRCKAINLVNCVSPLLLYTCKLQTMGLARYPNISPEGVWQFLQVSKVLDPQKSFQYTDSRWDGPWWGRDLHCALSIARLYLHGHTDNSQLVAFCMQETIAHIWLKPIDICSVQQLPGLFISLCNLYGGINTRRYILVHGFCFFLAAFYTSLKCRAIRSWIACRCIALCMLFEESSVTA